MDTSYLGTMSKCYLPWVQVTYHGYKLPDMGTSYLAWVQVTYHGYKLPTIDIMYHGYTKYGLFVQYLVVGDA